MSEKKTDEQILAERRQVAEQALRAVFSNDDEIERLTAENQAMLETLYQAELRGPFPTKSRGNVTITRRSAGRGRGPGRYALVVPKQSADELYDF